MKSLLQLIDNLASKMFLWLNEQSFPCLKKAMIALAVCLGGGVGGGGVGIDYIGLI